MLPVSVMLSEYLLLFIHTYLNFKIFGNFFFPQIFNFIQSHIVKTALKETTWGMGLLCFPAGEPKWRPPDFLKHQQTKSTTSYCYQGIETKLCTCFGSALLWYWKMFSEWVNVTLSFGVKTMSYRSILFFLIPGLYINEMCKLCVQPSSL
jgi:hypothetical protein